ncbi:MAG TPA: winged helix-turn-helix domain-containing protein [Thermoplasmatales archaeon]|nr:winged helix-turn-helix domain-containing protein [Thermoplasmatales archaeon]
MGRNRYSMYEEVGDLLKSITSSGVRAKMMMGLMEGCRTSGQLRDEIGVSSSTIIHAARDLEKESLLVEKEDGYHLTSVGYVISSKLSEMVGSMAILEKNKDFWLTHDVHAIPKEFLGRIDEIGEYNVLTSNVRDIFKTLTVYMELARKAKEFFGVSPIFVDAFIPLIKKLLKGGTKVNLVLTDDVVTELVGKDKKGFKEVLGDKNISIWKINEDVRVAFTVTDSIFSLGLFGLDGIYDASHDLVSREQGAINWGRELFEYYKSRARRLELEDI